METYELFKRAAALRTALILDESSGYPYTVAIGSVTGFSVLNNSSSNTVTFTITLEDTSVLSVPVTAGGAYVGEFEDAISTIAVTGTAPDFSVELMRRYL